MMSPMTRRTSRTGKAKVELQIFIAAILLVLAIAIPRLFPSKPPPPADVAPETTAATTSGS